MSRELIFGSIITWPLDEFGQAFSALYIKSIPRSPAVSPPSTASSLTTIRADLFRHIPAVP
jgi:hypothetical protein